MKELGYGKKEEGVPREVYLYIVLLTESSSLRSLKVLRSWNGMVVDVKEDTQYEQGVEVLKGYCQS
jgi:hypothetical protein